jgi:P2-related tail formation protein
MAKRHLLPPNATPFEKGMSLGFDREDLYGPKIESLRTLKLVDRPPNFLEWLIVEYGLGEISRFFDSGLDCIDTGIPWQRIKGTPRSLRDALSWIEYNNIWLEDQVKRRRQWHRYQIDMNKVPAVEDPVLYDAEYLATVSQPARSYFFRGYELWDVRPVEFGYKRWSRSLWGDSSGVFMPNGKTKWSHGQDYSVTAVADPLFKDALGINVSAGEVIDWDVIPWGSPGVSWGGVTNPRALKSYLMLRKTAHLAFYNAQNALIGFNRFKHVMDVTDANTPADKALIHFCCRTDFGAGYGHTAESVAVVIGGYTAPGVKPGKRWLTPGQLIFDPALVSDPIPLHIQFRRTVREHVQIHLEV